VQLFRRAVELLDDGVSVALATVVRARGSAPRHPGARMLVLANQATHGTIGGGRIELDVTAVGARVADGREPAQVVARHLVRDLAMCCGGSMDIYVEPLVGARRALAAAVEAVEARRPQVLVTPLVGGDKYLRDVRPGEAEATRVEVSEGCECLVEPLLPAARLLLFGAGHVARAIAPIAASVGFVVIVCDGTDDPGSAAAAATVVNSFDVRDVERDIGALGPSDYAVIVTRDHSVDQAILERLLPRDDLAYVGMIGSRGKVARFRRRLDAKGVATPERWERLHAPIGIDIAVETPQEIAVSIVAQLIDVRGRRRRASEVRCS
jgi:xanthine dehydrogenase accessory factor